MSEHGVSIGIDLDMQSIRAVKIRNTGKSTKPVISSIEEITGMFIKDEEVIAGLKAIRQRLSVSYTDTIITNIGGKQIYAAQIAFKKMPDEEMHTALKFEIRKNIPFDTAGATINYQFISQNVKKNELSPLVVTAVSNIILQRYLRVFEKSGLKPEIIDVFPLTIANAYHIHRDTCKEAEKNGCILHIGSEFSTIVIDGENIPFFNRIIYFAANELFGPAKSDQIAQREIERRIAAFTEEIVRSLAYYETTYHAKASNILTVLGNYPVPELLQKIQSDTGLTVKLLNLIGSIDNKYASADSKFDIALVLSMRN
jgi:Tfp pilus assembly PilM family ATPase